MVIGAGPRRFLATAMLHLAALGVLMASGVVGLDALLWLFLVGFLGHTLVGFAWHLAPSISRRRLVGVPSGPAYWVAAELAVLGGTVGLSGKLPPAVGQGVSFAAAVLWLLVSAVFTAALLRSSRGPALGTPPAPRPADAFAAKLFLLSWSFGVAAAALWVLSAVQDGPGLGYWLAGVHAFVLGQVALLIFGVSLRLLPRFVGADGPRWLAGALVASAVVGALGIPATMLLVPVGEIWVVGVPGLFEGMAALLFLFQLLWIGARATTPRRAHVIYLAGAVLLCAGGSLGFRMVTTSDLAIVGIHAWTTLLGFTGLMVLGMWFSMIAPFQFLSHRWTLRALAVGAILQVSAVLLVWSELAIPRSAVALATVLAGGLEAVLGILWAFGTLPVLFPSLLSRRRHAGRNAA